MEVESTYKLFSLFAQYTLFTYCIDKVVHFWIFVQNANQIYTWESWHLLTIAGLECDRLASVPRCVDVDECTGFPFLYDHGRDDHYIDHGRDDHNDDHGHDDHNDDGHDDHNDNGRDDHNNDHGHDHSDESRI